MLNTKWQLINFPVEVFFFFSHIISLNQHQWWLSNPVSFDQALQRAFVPSPPPLTFVGPGLCGCLTPAAWKKKEEGIIGGEHRLGRRACMCVWRECWLASADATQASAVSSHQLIPLPRSPLWSRGSQPASCDQARSAWTGRVGPRPPHACSPVPHHHCDIIETLTLRDGAQQRHGPTHSSKQWYDQ